MSGHVVAFGLREDERQARAQLGAIAEAGGGRFHDADQSSLAEALRRALSRMVLVNDPSGA